MIPVRFQMKDNLFNFVVTDYYVLEVKISQACETTVQKYKVFQKSGVNFDIEISKTIKDIATHLIYFESLQSQIFHGMFKYV